MIKQTDEAEEAFRLKLQEMGITATDQQIRELVSAFGSPENMIINPDEDKTTDDRQDKPKMTAGEPSTDKRTTDEGRSELQAIRERMRALEQENQRRKADSLRSSRQAQLETAIERLPEIARKAYAKVSLERLSEEDFSAMLGEIGTDAEAWQEGQA